MAFLGFEDGTIDFINTKRDFLNGTFEKELDRGIRSSAKVEGKESRIVSQAQL